MKIKNKQARKMFIEWYFGNNNFENNDKVDIIPVDKLPKSYGDIIKQMMEELIEDGESEWSFDRLLEVANGLPQNILNSLNYSDYLDDEMRADLEAQDYDTFGENKI